MKRLGVEMPAVSKRLLAWTFKRIVKKFAGGGVTCHDICNPWDHREKAATLRRAMVAIELRSVVFYQDVTVRHADKPSTSLRYIEVSEHFRDIEPGEGWRRISMTMIARLLNYRDHTGVKRLLDRAAESAKREST